MISPETARRVATDLDIDRVAADADGLFVDRVFLRPVEDVVAFLEDGEPVAVFGVTARWAGVGDLWGAVATPRVRAPLRLVWSCRALLETYAARNRLRRLAAWVGAEQATCIRFARLFGFACEHVDRGAAPDGTDLLLFMRRWQWD